MSDEYTRLQAQKQGMLRAQREMIAAALVKALTEGDFLKLPERMKGWGLASHRDAMITRVIVRVLGEQRCP